MTEQAEVRSVLSDADKELLTNYKKILSNTTRSVQTTEGTLNVLQRTITAMLGTDKYWAQEAVGHLKIGLLCLKTALNVEPTMDTLTELRKRKAKLDAETSELADFNRQPTVDPLLEDAPQVAELLQENPPVSTAEGQAN